VSSWQHPACLRVPGVTKAELTTQIFGTEALKPEDLTFLIDTLCSDTAGRCRLPLSKPELKARLVSAIENKM
jgi:hypothetical protein